VTEAVADPLDRGPKLIACTVIVEPCTTVTLPITRSGNPPNRPAAPLGAVLGRRVGVAVGVPVGRRPPKPPPAPVHEPDAEGVIVTVVAASGAEGSGAVVGDEPLGAAPDAVMQLPGFTAARSVVTVLVNRVLPVTSTVTCPSVGFCSSKLAASTSAMVPDAPGAARPPGPPAAPVAAEDDPAAAAGEGPDPPPHAVSTNDAMVSRAGAADAIAIPRFAR
jgi:hypothetical protein